MSLYWSTTKTRRSVGRSFSLDLWRRKEAVKKQVRRLKSIRGEGNEDLHHLGCSGILLTPAGQTKAVESLLQLLKWVGEQAWPRLQLQSWAPTCAYPS